MKTRLPHRSSASGRAEARAVRVPNAPASIAQQVRQIVHAPRAQAKLTVGAPDDAFEREADQVADQVMRMPDPGASISSTPPGVRRRCAECEEEMHAKAAPGRLPQVRDGFEQRFAAIRGSGQPLPAPERAFFEPRFGLDFSSVRVHTDAHAARLSQELNAHAFTHGQDISFALGCYDWGSAAGRRLIAHELAHVVQQRRGTSAAVQLQAAGAGAGAEEGGDIYPFYVKATKVLSKDESAILVLQKAFRVDEATAQEILRLMRQNGWFNEDYPGITQEDVRKGTHSAGLQVTFYRGITRWLGRSTRGGVETKEGEEKPAAGGGQGETPVTPPIRAEKPALNKEIDKRYWEQTGIEKGSKIGKGEKEKGKAELWKDIQAEVLGQREQLQKLPADIQKLMGGTQSSKPQDYDQLLRIAGKLANLMPEERLLYKQIATQLTSDLNRFEQAVDEYIRFRDEYKAAIEKAATSAEGEKNLEEKVAETWKRVDVAGIQTKPRAERVSKARELAWEQTKVRLEHMMKHPGETAVGMAKGLSPVDVAEGVIRDVKEAASGDKSAMARWAAGVGGVGKISGWVAAVAAVAYVGLLLVPGVNVVVLAKTALIVGMAAVALATVESELRVQAAGEATTEEEFRRNVEKAAEAQTTAIAGAVMMVAGFALKLVGAIRLPGRLQNVSHALNMAKKSVLRVTGAGPALESVRATLRKAILGERAGLPEALAEGILEFRKNMRELEGMTGEQFLERLARGDKGLNELTEITPDQAKQYLELERTPAGKGMGEKLRQDFLRALRDAPGEAQARVDRAVKNMDDILADIDAAKTPEELAAAVDRSQQRFDVKKLTEEAAAEQRAAMEQRLKEESLKEPPAQANPEPAAEAPPAMSDPLKAMRKSLTDPRAIEQFDARFKAMKENSARMQEAMEGIRAAGAKTQPPRTLEQRLIDDWEKAHPAPRTPYGASIGEVPELRVHADALKADIDAYANSNPKVSGLAEWKSKLIKLSWQLDQMLKGELEATATDVTGARANIDSIQAEFKAALREPGVTAVQENVPAKAGSEPIFEVDVVADGGKTWIDVKRVEPFSVESSNWKGKPGAEGGTAKKGLKAQAEDLCEAAKNNPVDGTPPKVVYDFPLGVSEAVAKALKAIGREKGVALEMRGPVIPDTKVVLPPGRTYADDYDEAIAR